MDARFDFVTDVGRNMIRIKMGGFFSEEDVGRFAATIDQS
jgi:hypothetical protein